jgi:hypothetical protein
MAAVGRSHCPAGALGHWPLKHFGWLTVPVLSDLWFHAVLATVTLISRPRDFGGRLAGPAAAGSQHEYPGGPGQRQCLPGQRGGAGVSISWGGSAFLMSR